MSIRILLIMLTVFICPSLAYSNCGTFTSGALLKTCEIGLQSAAIGLSTLSPDDAYNSGTCLGYIKGFVYMELAYSATLAVRSNPNASNADVRKKALFCLPEGVKNKDYAEIFVNYMHKHPEENDKDSCSSMLSAFSQAYPCPASGN